MKVLVQDARRNPRDWRQIEPLEWGLLPKRPVPATGELGGQNNQDGWVSELNVQGVHFNGFDHYAVEAVFIGAEEGVKVTAWNDDPDDWPVGERQARVWTFLPLAPDPTLGFAINTRQSQLVYAEGERFTQLEANVPQNTSVRPWAEFVPPAESITRHGVWLTDEKFAEHRRVSHSFQNNDPAHWGWRHWCDHLPESETELDQFGRRVLKGQRDQGRYRIPSRTKTYYQRDTDLAQGWITATNENQLATSAGAGETESITVGSAFAQGWGFASPSGEPNSSSWNGTYHTQIDCTAASDGLTYMAQVGASVNAIASWDRVSSDLSTDLETEVQSQAAVFSGTGLKLATSGDETGWTSPATTNRYGVAITVQGDSHADAITLRFSSDAYADGPWSAGASVSVTGVVAGAPATAPLPTITAVQITSITAVLAGASSTALTGSVQIARSIAGELAAAPAGTPIPTVTAVQIVSVAGGVASSLSATLTPAVTAVQIVSVTGVTATTSADALIGMAQVARSVTGEVATASADALTGVVTAVTSATISAVTAVAPAEVLAGAVQIARSVPAEVATANAGVLAGTITAVRVVSITGEAASASAAALAGTISTGITASITGEIAAAPAEALVGVVTAIRIVSVVGEVAAAPADVLIPSATAIRIVNVTGEVASATADSLAPTITAARLVAVSGEVAAATADALAGVITAGAGGATVSVVGEVASALADALAATVTAVRTVSVAGEPATATADVLGPGLEAVQLKIGGGGGRYIPRPPELQVLAYLRFRSVELILEASARLSVAKPLEFSPVGLALSAVAYLITEKPLASRPSILSIAHSRPTFGVRTAFEQFAEYDAALIAQRRRHIEAEDEALLVAYIAGRSDPEYSLEPAGGTGAPVVRLGRPRLETDPIARDIYARGEELRRRYPGMTVGQVAGRLGVASSTYKRYRAVFREEENHGREER